MLTRLAAERREAGDEAHAVASSESLTTFARLPLQADGSRLNTLTSAINLHKSRLRILDKNRLNILQYQRIKNATSGAA